MYVYVRGTMPQEALEMYRHRPGYLSFVLIWNVALTNGGRVLANHNGKREYSLRSDRGLNTLSAVDEFNWKLVGNNFSSLEIRNWKTLLGNKSCLPDRCPVKRENKVIKGASGLKRNT